MEDKIYNKYLSIDYGTKRVGLASGAIFPKGLGVIDASKGDAFVLEEIKKIVEQENYSGIIIGLPTRSQGEAGTLDSRIRKFADELSRSTSLAIYFQEENFSSSEAQNLFISNDKKVQRKSGEVDEMAAIIILERFLEHSKNDQYIKPDISS